MDRFWRAITAVAMESAGIYWKPIFNILEDDFDVVLANAKALKNVPGRKTDVKDCPRTLYLFRNGLISGSFIPPREIREPKRSHPNAKETRWAMTSEKNREQIDFGGCEHQDLVRCLKGLRSVLPRYDLRAPGERRALRR